MKKLLLFVSLLVLASSVHSQVGIGTPLPNNSSQLDVVANGKGILIPRISLTSEIDVTTITSGNVLSLLVFNTSFNDQLTPGYYYWDGVKWQRMVNSDDIGVFETLTTLVYNGDGSLSYADEDSVIHVIDLAAIIGDFETLTSITDTGDGSITYLDEDGNPTIINIAMIIDQFETVTSLVDNNDGTVAYTDENGDITIIELSTIIDNFETLTIIGMNVDGVNLDYEDEDGNITQVNLAAVVSANETVTTLVESNGSYTYTSEDGTMVIFDVTQSGTGDPITNITVGVAGDVYVDESTGDVWTYNSTTNTWEQQTGVSDSLVGLDGTYTHIAVDGTVETFDVTQSGTGDPITNTTVGVAGDVYVDESTGDVWTYNSTTNTWEQQTGVSDSLVGLDG
ncbi:MAG: hypothetical protein ACJAZK_002755, partial [Psychroserpens sp.]